MRGYEIFQLLSYEIGENTAKKVFELFSGEDIHFPKNVIILIRDLEILKRFEKGESYEELGRAYNLSSSRIRSLTSPHKRKEILEKAALLKP